ncbi:MULTISPECIES: HpcH/HpaI aldolase/citrate lyase family protein [Glutamicibacter]|jgi:2-keto-3-deoxy-L-rhamnonate aldolase RhmA|uniref:Aldolase n=1 Tax=Glutamicibacter arilaitensis TaxID=256701 RepID=A0A4Y8TWC8_9MICC|nr:aldolase/citrate lyase family protein [Glutamicibacter arilaitensis]TFH55831.1 aldolase [Glutamicibacter arilaitensis]
MSRASGASPVLLHVALPSMAVIESALNAGYDGVMIDLQHGEIGLDQACNLLRAIPRGNPWVYARVASIDSGAIGRLLDSGARGIVAPTVETVEQAQALVHAVKYPPLGGRSLGPSRPNLYPGENYCDAGNAAVAAVAQIESAAGVSAAAQIAAVPGIASLYVGPSDLAVTYGLGGGADWEDGPVAEAVGELAAITKDAGIGLGLYCSDAAFALKQMRIHELAFAGLGIDLLYVGKQARVSLAALEDKA